MIKNLKAFKSFLTEKKRFVIPFLVVAIIAGMFYLRKIVEGFTSCSQLNTCSSCVDAAITDTSSPCYWNNQKKLCGSFLDAGYSRQCPTSPDPTPEPTPEPEPEPEPIIKNPTRNKNCPVCPKLTLLKSPTFITQQ